MEVFNDSTKDEGRQDATGIQRGVMLEAVQRPEERREAC
jgi:hypothetical protein